MVGSFSNLECLNLLLNIYSFNIKNYTTNINLTMVKVLVLYYSTYGHIHTMAEAVAEGAKSAGAEVHIKRVPETLSDEILGKMGALEAHKA